MDSPTPPIVDHHTPPPPIVDHHTPPPPIVDHHTPPPPLLTLTDELLEEIFIRLPTPTDLALACIACSSFHRIITDRSFLRRFRAFHPPPLLGFIANGFHAAEAPHPSARLARTLALAADFSYSFIPAGRWLTPWQPHDVRQGRVLLECFPESPVDYDDVGFPTLELAVCDPLYRLYVLLPPIPDELTSGYEDLKDFGLFLAPTKEDEQETSFRVVLTAWSTTGLVAFVFSSITAQWHIAASPSWSSLGIVIPSDAWNFSWFYYAGGCFYWTLPLGHRLLVLDVLRMEFSIVNYNPPSYFKQDSREPRFVVDREGSPELLFLGDYIKDGVDGLFRIAKKNDGEPSDKWQVENIVPLPLTGWRTLCVALGMAEGFLFLRAIPIYNKSLGSSSEECLDGGCFSLDVKTSELKKVCGIEQSFFHAHAYFGFPPSLSKPCL